MMSDTVLLIMGIPDQEDNGLTLKMVHGRLDVASVDINGMAMDEGLADRAMSYANNSSKKLTALQVMTSDLFHWGYNDTILPGPAKTRFIGYIREQILDKSLKTTKMLKEKAIQYNIPIEIKRIETDDPVSTVLDEARKGYDRIFIGKTKKKIFPLLKKNLNQHLRKNISVPIEH